jgi:hypothetical protein
MKISMTENRIVRTTINLKNYEFDKSGILKNVGILKCQNVGIFAKQKSFQYNSLKIRLNIKINKAIINSLNNHLYNQFNKYSNE